MNPRTRAELLDFDYLKSLKSEELEWLAQFVDESIHASIQKTKTGKVKSGYLHNTPELAKMCTDANNWRNNDIHSVTRANNLLYDVSSSIDSNDGWYITNTEYQELAIISQIDTSTDDRDLTLAEYVESRPQFKEEIKSQIDVAICRSYCLDIKDFYTIVCSYALGLIGKRWIVDYSSSKLKKFLQNTKLVEKKNSSSNST